MKQDIKKLYTSSNSTPFRIPWTKFETYNPIDVGEDRFQVDMTSVKSEPQNIMT